jgi:PAS domain S-box-containing protein
VQYISIRRDINQRKSAEEKMRNAVERFQFLAQATSDTIWDWDIESDKMLYNEAITPMLGYDKSEVNNINEWWKQNIHPDDIDDITKAIELAVAEKKQNLQLEYRFKCENGEYKFIYDRALIIYNANGKASRMIGAMQDVTYQREEEHRINNAVVDAQEAERQYLGMELHDNINQLLTGTLLMLSAAAHVKMDGKEVLKLAEKCKDHLTNAVEEIRNLSHRLSPAAFTTSLQQEFVFLITQMSATAGFAAIHNLNISNEKTIPAEIKICLYRILQEQLSNICKHAKAQKVSVTLIQASNKVFLKIADDGVGFNPKEINQGIGLSNIKKRVGYFSGRFNLTAATGKGCSIDVELPYQHNTTAL